MTTVFDRLRGKFKFVLMKIDKARGREMVARRKTNNVLERSKNAEKKSFYLRHKLDALTDKLFIYNIRIERIFMNLKICRNKSEESKNKYLEDDRLCIEKRQKDISNLEQLELQYKSSVSVLLLKRDAMVKRLDEVEKRITSTNECVKILEQRLMESYEVLRIKKMKQDLYNQRRTSRAQVLIQLRRYLELAKSRKSRADKKIERLVKVIKEIAVNLEVQEKVTLKSKKEVQRLLLTKRKCSTC